MPSVAMRAVKLAEGTASSGAWVIMSTFASWAMAYEAVETAWAMVGIP